jgi:hypothetical protein
MEKSMLGSENDPHAATLKPQNTTAKTLLMNKLTHRTATGCHPPTSGQYECSQWDATGSCQFYGAGKSAGRSRSDRKNAAYAENAISVLSLKDVQP